jgi:hypothetical protein
VGLLQGLSVPWSDTLCKRAIDEGRMSTSDVASCWGDSDAARQLGIQTYVSAPIRNVDGVLLEDLQRALSRGLREGTSVLVGLIDLDSFKVINDSYGHQCGDQFLQEMARRLGTSLRASDMLGRLGGDEFVIVGTGPALPAILPAGPVIANDEPHTAAQVLQGRVAAIGR